MPPAENSEAGRLLKSQPRDSASYTMADKEEERKAYGAITNDGRRNSLVDAADDEAIIPKGALDPVYEAKARILNRAIQDLGMGRYQWELFVVIGFGWASDNLWPIVTSLILTPVANEFRVSNPPYLTLAQNIGLLAGAMFWGFGCDVCKSSPPCTLRFLLINFVSRSKKGIQHHSRSYSNLGPHFSQRPQFRSYRHFRRSMVFWCWWKFTS